MKNFKKMVAAMAMMVVMSFTAFADGILVSDRSGILVSDRSGILVSDKNAPCSIKDMSAEELGGILVSDLIGILIVGKTDGILIVGKSDCSN